MLNSNTKKYMHECLLVYGTLAVLGFAALILGTFFNILKDEMPGICLGFIPTGVLGIILTLRMKSNPEKAEKMVRVKTEERLQIIRYKAGNLTFRISFCFLCAATIFSKYISLSLTYFLSITILGILAVHIVSLVIYNKID